MHETLTLFDSLVNGEYFGNRFWALRFITNLALIHPEVPALSVIPILLAQHDMPASTATCRRVRQRFCKMHGYVTDVDCNAVASRLESLGYMMVYLIQGRLSWQGWKGFQVIAWVRCKNG